MKKRIKLFLLLLAMLIWSILFAQNYDEDKLIMQQYKLPEKAVLETSLVVRDTICYKGDKPFSGTAYALYSDNMLKHSTQYRNGLKHGIMYVWYPDGKPQLMSYYRNGHLNGRFKGWYQFGGVIYDIVMRDGQYSGDDLMESDTTRSQTDTIEKDTGQDGIDQANGE